MNILQSGRIKLVGKRFVGAMCLAALMIPYGATARPILPRQVLPVESSLSIAQRGQVSLQQAVTIATRRYRGRVVRAETVTRNGQPIHEIRILDDEGRVRTVHVDPQNGALR